MDAALEGATLVGMYLASFAALVAVVGLVALAVVLERRAWRLFRAYWRRLGRDRDRA